MSFTQMDMTCIAVTQHFTNSLAHRSSNISPISKYRPIVFHPGQQKRHYIIRVLYPIYKWVILQLAKQSPSSNQTWRAGKWTMKISDVPSYKPPFTGDFPSYKPPFSAVIFQPAMLHYQRIHLRYI